MPNQDYSQNRPMPRPPLDQGVAPAVRQIAPRPRAGDEGTLGGSYLTPTHFGTYSLWVDSSGRLRIKSTAPTSDTDGTVVGTQA
jgi:hypothetical protein